MSLFIARYKKNNRCSTWDNPENRFKENLPFNPGKVTFYKLKKTELIVFNYNLALERKTKVLKDSVTIVQGYGDITLENRLLRCFDSGCRLSLLDFPEAFCSVNITNHSLDFCTSLSGIDPLFFLDTKNEFVATNRHNLLQSYIVSENISFRKNAFAWMMGRGMLADLGVYWEGIDRAFPGNIYHYESDEISKIKPNLFRSSPIETNEIYPVVRNISDYFSQLVDGVNSKKIVSLSGGKDSRAICGLLANASTFENFEFFTFGELFAPDVMAASDVAKALNADKRHTVVGSHSFSQNNLNIFEKIAEDLAWCFSGNSLADIRNFKSDETLHIGGYESLIKALPNNLSLHDFLQSKKSFVDRRGVLSEEMFNAQYLNYSNSLKELLVDAPQSRYKQLETLFFTNGAFVMPPTSASHASTSEIHPFLDGRMTNLWLNVSDEVLSNQFIHYLMTRHPDKSLEYLPYADDDWPEALKTFANENNYQFLSSPRKPYLFHHYFPSQKSLGLYQWRLDLVSASIPFILEYIHSNKNFFDFINLSKLVELSKIDIDYMTLNDIYFWLGALKACLVYEFGESSLSFSNRKDIANKISDLLRPHSSLFSESIELGTASAEKSLQSAKNKILEYEKCIEDMVREQRKTNYSTEPQKDSILRELISLNDNKILLKRYLKKINFTELDKNGYIIELNQDNSNTKVLVVELNLVSLSPSPRKALVFIDEKLSNSAPIGFQRSVNGFWYKYVPTGDLINHIDTTIDLSKLDLSVYKKGMIKIMPWYNEDTILIEPIKILQI